MSDKEQRITKIVLEILESMGIFMHLTNRNDIHLIPVVDINYTVNEDLLVYRLELILAPDHYDHELYFHQHWLDNLPGEVRAIVAKRSLQELADMEWQNG